MKSMVKYFEKTTNIRGGNKVKKFSVIMALAMGAMLTLGASVAMAAPGDYLPGGQITSDKYTTTLDSTSGKSDSTSFGLKNNLTNANQTGTGEEINDGTTANKVIKNVTGQKTHGEYQNDTNSCASCHQTHTASGKKLLFKNGTYNTCTACHDGTLGFYNVFTPSNAGTFGGNPDKAMGNASVHMATGVMTVAAAPGGNRTSTDAGTWGKEFNCASCHSPHGSYSDRLLHYNPNGVGTIAPTDANGVATGGKKIVNATVAFDSATGKYTAVDATAKTIAGPFLYGYTYGKPKLYWTQIRVKDATGAFTYKYDASKSWNDVLDVNYGGGYFKDPNGVLAGKTVADIQIDVAPATIVKMNSTQIATTPNNVPVLKIDSYKNGVSGFCAACHTDYNATSAQTESGTFSKAFRHKIVQGLKNGMIGEEALVNGVATPNQNMVCLSCHYAHGTDKSVMLDAKDTAVAAPDVNASSALKRYTNMAVCWKCHTDSKAEQLKNNSSYWTQHDAGTGPVN